MDTNMIMDKNHCGFTEVVMDKIIATLQWWLWIKSLWLYKGGYG
jgi:hypothetical protein